MQWVSPHAIAIVDSFGSFSATDSEIASRQIDCESIANEPETLSIVADFSEFQTVQHSECIDFLFKFQFH